LSASQGVERYHRPAIVLASRTASRRVGTKIAPFHLLDALSRCRTPLQQIAASPAAGLTLSAAPIDEYQGGQSASVTGLLQATASESRRRFRPPSVGDPYSTPEAFRTRAHARIVVKKTSRSRLNALAMRPAASLILGATRKRTLARWAISARGKSRKHPSSATEVPDCDPIDPANPA